MSLLPLFLICVSILLQLRNLSQSLSPSQTLSFSVALPSSSAAAAPRCMRRRGAQGSKTGSMRVKSVRCGFGVKCFRFLHVKPSFFLFLFLRETRFALQP